MNRKPCPADMTDEQWALPEPLADKLPRLERLWADGGYAGQLVA